MQAFDFLKNITFKENLGVKLNMDKNPTGLKLRLFKNGRVYPSEELVTRFKLEYGVEGGNAIDYFNTKEWGPYPKDAPEAVVIGFSPRTEAKLDLFGYTRKKKGEEASIMQQGPEAVGLWELIVNTYKLTDIDNWPYIDLEVNMDIPIKTEDSIYLLPKKVSRGKNIGKLTYQRRENINLFLLLPGKMEFKKVVGSASRDIEQLDLVAVLTK